MTDQNAREDAAEHAAVVAARNAEWWERGDLIAEANADARADADAGRMDFGSGRWAIGAWQDDADYSRGWDE